MSTENFLCILQVALDLPRGKLMKTIVDRMAKVKITFTCYPEINPIFTKKIIIIFFTHKK